MAQRGSLWQGRGWLGASSGLAWWNTFWGWWLRVRSEVGILSSRGFWQVVLQGMSNSRLVFLILNLSPKVIINPQHCSLVPFKWRQVLSAVTKLLTNPSQDRILYHFVKWSILPVDPILVLGETNEIVCYLPIMRDGYRDNGIFVIIFGWVRAENIR